MHSPLDWAFFSHSQEHWHRYSLRLGPGYLESSCGGLQRGYAQVTAPGLWRLKASAPL
jgi:hypothetical protein